MYVIPSVTSISYHSLKTKELVQPTQEEIDICSEMNKNFSFKALFMVILLTSGDLNFSQAKMIHS